MYLYVVFWMFLQFSKAASKLKDAISSLPIATEEDDIDEAAILKGETEMDNHDDDKKKPTVDRSCIHVYYSIEESHTCPVFLTVGVLAKRFLGSFIS